MARATESGLIYWESIHHSAPAGTVVVVVANEVFDALGGVLNAIIFSKPD